ncbi:hypothetical protein TNCV_4186021 [Trichonephila clavipes]|nr:hypothetical protein TNCV_4186021 [Trichonephila clavipes]
MATVCIDYPTTSGIQLPDMERRKRSWPLYLMLRKVALAKWSWLSPGVTKDSSCREVDVESVKAEKYPISVEV